MNGIIYGTYTTSASGEYSIPVGAFVSGDCVLVYIDSDIGHLIQGNTVTVAGTTDITGLDIYGGTVIARHNVGSSITNAKFSKAKGNQSDADILYTMNGTTLDLNANFLIWTGKTFAPGADVYISGDWDSSVK